MSLYRCAACGSDRVVTDNQAGGIRFNAVKGVVGTMALGAGGAVAGLENKTETVYKCPDCGTVLSYPMPNEIKVIIDAGCMSVRARNNLTLWDMPVSWEVLKSKYPNIDSSAADSFEEKMKEMRMEYAGELADEIRELIEDFKRDLEVIETQPNRIEELQREWEKSKAEVIAKIQSIEEQNNQAKKAIEEKKNEIEKDYKNKEAMILEKEKVLEDENAKLKAQLSELSIFKRTEKKQIKNFIEENEASLKQISDEKESINLESKSRLEALEKKYFEDVEKLKKDAPVLEKSPYERRDVILKLKKIYNHYKWNSDDDDNYLDKELHPLIIYFYIQLVQTFDVSKKFLSNELNELIEELIAVQEDIFNIGWDWDNISDYSENPIRTRGKIVTKIEKELCSVGLVEKINGNSNAYTGRVYQIV